MLSNGSARIVYFWWLIGRNRGALIIKPVSNPESYPMPKSECHDSGPVPPSRPLPFLPAGITTRSYAIHSASSGPSTRVVPQLAVRLAQPTASTSAITLTAAAAFCDPDTRSSGVNRRRARRARLLSRRRESLRPYSHRRASNPTPSPEIRIVSPAPSRPWKPTPNFIGASAGGSRGSHVGVADGALHGGLVLTRRRRHMSTRRLYREVQADLAAAAEIVRTRGRSEYWSRRNRRQIASTRRKWESDGRVSLLLASTVCSSPLRRHSRSVLGLLSRTPFVYRTSSNPHPDSTKVDSTRLRTLRFRTRREMGRGEADR
ncbi:hypothetical protein B0H12DRAFT_1074777 [Mycena haematopus]|nr:hypothetical protein B0H12DRAFT_1074777 [Mycena haematopus]